MVKFDYVWFGLVWLNIGQMTLTGNNIRPNLDFLSTDGTPGVVEVQGVPRNMTVGE